MKYTLLSGKGACSLVIIGTILLLASCRTVKYVGAVHRSAQVEERLKFRIDSVRTHDSIYIERKGDTLIKERFNTRYLTRIKTDTLYVRRTDSVSVPYPVETIKEVKKPLTWYEKAIGYWGLLSLGAVAGLILWKAKRII